MQNPNWIRWIKSSINLHFDALISGIPLFIEGENRDDGLKSSAELRMDGPDFSEISKGYWQFDIMIDVLIKSHFSDKDAYIRERNIGYVLAAFTTDISIFRYGDSADDDRTALLGCFKLCPSEGEPIRVLHFGQVTNDIRLTQTSVQAAYRMNLTT